MKQIFLAFTLLISISLQAQLTTIDVSKPITIGKVKPGGIRLLELEYSLTPTNDTLYHLSYRDKSYTAIDVWDDVYFKGGQATLDGFYNLLKAAVEADKKTEKAFKLGETNILAVTDASFGTKIVRLAITKKGGTIGLTEITANQVNKLFGK